MFSTLNMFYKVAEGFLLIRLGNMPSNPVENGISTFVITSTLGGVGKVGRLESSCQYTQTISKPYVLKYLYPHHYYFFNIHKL